jgi:hypothetical protein
MRERTMTYEPPPPTLMSGKEAIEYIQCTDNIPEAEAVDQLRAAILNRAVGEVPVDIKTRPPFGSSPIGVPTPSVRSPEMWRNAKITAKGTVRFPGERRYRLFKVVRENVLNFWPPRSQPASVAPDPQSLSQRQAELGRRRRLQQAILAAARYYRIINGQTAKTAWHAISLSPFSTKDGSTVTIEDERMCVQSKDRKRNRRGITYSYWEKRYWSEAKTNIPLNR